MYKYKHYCRWCGFEYKARIVTDRDGFCTDAHKQALHRAFNKYVTTRLDLKRERAAIAEVVTQKKRTK